MPTPPVTNKKITTFSIQTVYSLYPDIDRSRREGVPTLYCKNVIKIPIAEPVARQIGINTYTVTPYTALVVENDNDNIVKSALKIVIETNEGVTVEPIVVHAPLVQYDTAYLLTLPRGTTGIKKAYVRVRNGDRIIQNDLVFDIMETPYNYENYLFALNHAEFVSFREQTVDQINELFTGMQNLNEEVENLKARVTALENKAGN